MRPDDASSPSQRVRRLLDHSSPNAPAGPDAAPGPDDVWPSNWPPGAEIGPGEPGPGSSPGWLLGGDAFGATGTTGLRWQVPHRAAAAVAGLALLIITVLIMVMLNARGSSPGTAVPARQPIPLAVGSTAAPGPVTSPTAVGGQVDGALGAPALAAGGAAQPSVGQYRVYVVGQVRHPGVVSLAPGARVEDAVDGAGGATATADLAVMNLARKVVDGERIVVPRPGEKVPTADPVPAAEGAMGTGGGAVGEGAPAAGAPVDLNTATVAQLDALPGVGPVIAGRIVAWRQQNGRFNRVDDLGEVSGIGDATLEKLRSLVRV